MLEHLSKNVHFDIMDINSELSADGVLKSEGLGPKELFDRLSGSGVYTTKTLK